jgi:hypothetical protein
MMPAEITAPLALESGRVTCGDTESAALALRVPARVFVKPGSEVTYEQELPVASDVAFDWTHDDVTLMFNVRRDAIRPFGNQIVVVPTLVEVTSTPDRK